MITNIKNTRLIPLFFICLLHFFVILFCACGQDQQTKFTYDLPDDLKTIRVIVHNRGVDILAIEEEAAGEKKMPERSDAAFVQETLKSLGFTPVSGELDGCDATLEVEINNQSLGAWYAPERGGGSVYLYTGAMTSGKLELRKEDKSIASHTFKKVLQPLLDSTTDVEAFTHLAGSSLMSPNAGGLWLWKRFEIQRILKRELLYVLFGPTGKVESLVTMLMGSDNWEECYTLGEALQLAGWAPKTVQEKARYHFGMRDWDKLRALGTDAIPVLRLGEKESYYSDIREASQKYLREIQAMGTKD